MAKNVDLKQYQVFHRTFSGLRLRADFTCGAQ